ncbi:hypothetical protein AX16_003690 [Volvariella volvacea WC 439]|nr:hypothetical protein AX16_003690 [Volvariella volvacea WC 439]
MLTGTASSTILSCLRSFCVTDPIFRLVNPYVQPILYVRKPGDDFDQVHTFPDDDPFFSEISNLIDIVEDIEEDPDAAQILSSYEDAVKTYELTWAIREASEKSRAAGQK